MKNIFKKEEGGKPQYIDEIPTMKDFLERINDSGTIIHDDIFKEESNYNNIIYFDEINDNSYKKQVYDDWDLFEDNTNGAFIFCEDIQSLEIIKKEILAEYNNNKYKFNLITTGNAWEKSFNKILNYDNDWKKIIQNVCIYCSNIKKYNYLYEEYDIIKCIWSTPAPVVRFIKKTSSKEILPFPYVQLITYKRYKKDYNIFHKMISAFYGENKKEHFKKNYEKMEALIEEEKKTKKLKKSAQKLKRLFEKFDDNEEKEKMNKIIKEYTKENF